MSPFSRALFRRCEALSCPYEFNVTAVRETEMTLSAGEAPGVPAQATTSGIHRSAYSPEIDGLRAIAVLPVVLYHAAIAGFGGGFVGVDVFFVISGYLITGIIVGEIARGQFSIARFYERRIRRIFPALFFVMVCSIVTAAFFFVPRDLTRFGESVAAATVFVSNLLFWRETGYFAAAAGQQPLLHTWSLAIEEQFYIAFPLLLLAIARFGRGRYASWLVGVAILSFALSVYAVYADAATAFYLAPTRAWELLLGSLLACDVISPAGGVRTRNALAAIGLVLIAFSVTTFTVETPFPGVAALWPTLGTALVIYSVRSGASHVTGMLAAKPLVYIGLMSYSLYLWHWPLIVFTRYWSIVELGSSAIVLILVASLMLSVFTWKFIETPFRSKRLLVRRESLFFAAAAAMVMLCATGIVIHVQRGMIPGVDPDIQLRQESEWDNEWSRWGECENRASTIASGGAPCHIGAADKPATFLLWGDSHARSVTTAVDRSAAKFSVAGLVTAKSACPPLLGIERKNRAVCGEFNEHVLDYIRDHPELRTVILSGRWALAAHGTYYRAESSRPDRAGVQLVDVYAGYAEGRADSLFRLGLSRTIAALAALHRNVVLVSPIPEVGYDVPSAVVVATRTRRDVNALIAPTVAEYTRRNQTVFDSFESLERPGVQVVNPAGRICDTSRCLVEVDGHPLYRDEHHLSTDGARYIAPVFDSLFAEQSVSGAITHALALQ